MVEARGIEPRSNDLQWRALRAYPAHRSTRVTQAGRLLEGSPLFLSGADARTVDTLASFCSRSPSRRQLPGLLRSAKLRNQLLNILVGR